MVSIHSDNTSTKRSHAGRPPMPIERGRTILRQFGIGGERSMDDLAATSREPIGWKERWHQLAAGEVCSAGGSAPLPAIVLYRLACELTGARRTSAIGGGIGDFAPRLEDGASRERGADRRCDVVFLDLASDPPDRDLLGSALRALSPTGLLVLAGVHPVRNGRALRGLLTTVTADRYPEVEALTTDRDGSNCWLLSRVLSSQRRE
jgi:hypothetical protein